MMSELLVGDASTPHTLRNGKKDDWLQNNKIRMLIKWGLIVVDKTVAAAHIKKKAAKSRRIQEIGFVHLLVEHTRLCITNKLPKSLIHDSEKSRRFSLHILSFLKLECLKISNISWLFDCWIQWLIDWSICWLVDCVIDWWLIHWLSDWSVDFVIGWYIGRFFQTYFFLSQ